MTTIEAVRADLRAQSERITTSVGKVHERLDDIDRRLTVLEPEVSRMDRRGEAMATTIDELGKADVRVEEQIKALTGAFDVAQAAQERRHSEVIDAVKEVRAESATKAGDGEEGIQQWVRQNPALSLVLITILGLVSFSVGVDVLRGDISSQELLDRIEAAEQRHSGEH